MRIPEKRQMRQKERESESLTCFEVEESRDEMEAFN